jgi:CDP-diacylglycerol pyrophosphatase
MNAIKGLFWATIISLLLWVVIIITAHGIVSEVNLREYRYSDGWWKWQHERALNEYKTQKEWTR